MGKFTSWLAHTWDAFTNRDPTKYKRYGGNGSNPDRVILTRGNERSIINAVYNRIAMDVASNTFEHARLDHNGRFSEVVDDGLNTCLTLEANIDQTSRAFIQNLVLSMLDEGNICALITTTRDNNPYNIGTYDITSMRIGQIQEWYPQAVRVRAYNHNTGMKDELIVPKRATAIIENPFYIVMNEPNSMAARLLRKLAMLDAVDDKTNSSKLDLIIQLPYTIKTEAKRIQVENRKKEVEDQLTNSKYGIAYIDASEKIVQLNRSLENNYMEQIKYFQELLFSCFGITQGILDGTADEQTMLNYYSRTIEPISSAIADEFKRKFLTKTARTKGETIYFFKDPFKLVPVSQIADIADKFTRNEIFTSNEIRQIIGVKPSKDPAADELRNKNLNRPEGDSMDLLSATEGPVEDYDSSMEELDDIDKQIAELESML